MSATATLTRPAFAAAPKAPAPTSAPISIDTLARMPLAALTQLCSPAVEVFASTEGTAPKPLWDQHSRLGDDHLAEMQRYRGTFAFWVKKTDFSRVQTSVQTHWHELAATQSLPTCDSLALLSLAFSLELSPMLV